MSELENNTTLTLVVNSINVLLVTYDPSKATPSIAWTLTCFFQNGLSYFATGVIYVRKIFMKSTPGVNVKKNYGRILRIFELSYSVCLLQAFPD